MKNRNQPGLFDHQERIQKLDRLKDPLVSIGESIDFEAFRPVLESATLQKSYAKGGRPPFDRVMLLKALILQRLYDLSDDQLEFQINDRISFMRFLGLQLSDKVPDAKTFWHYREQLVKTGVIDQLFVLFKDRLKDNGYMVQGGKIVDASLVRVKVQRNSKDENDQIKNDETPEGWSEPKRRQKDVDARWTRKHGKNHFGYKNHVKVNAKTKIIENFEVTPANVHDSQVVLELVEEADAGCTLYGDTAYDGKDIRKGLRRRKVGSRIQKRSSRHVKLTAHQKGANKYKARTRCRVEHVFASIRNRARNVSIKVVSLARVTAVITLDNLIYNIGRALYLDRIQWRSVPECQ